MSRFLACLAVLFLAALPAGAEDRAARLDRLHAALAEADGPAEAQAAADRIWRIWYMAPDATAQAMLDDAVRAERYADHATALAVLARLTADYPDYPEGWNRMATVLYLTGRDEASLAAIDRVLALEPRHFGALAGRVMIHARQGRSGATREALEAALRVHPFLPERALLEPPGEPL